MKRAERITIFAALVGTLAAAPLALAAPIKVACIGPQHVHSHQLDYPREYPAKLQKLLGADYMVGNFGDCCATILRGYPRQRETHPYLEGGESYPQVGPGNFKDSVKFMPDIAVIGPWGKHDTEIANQLYKGTLDRAKFEADYEELIKTYQNLPSKPKIYLFLPIPIPYGQPTGVVTSVMLPAMKAVADRMGIPVMDAYAAFLNKRELFKDPTHITNDTGLDWLAMAAYKAIKDGEMAGGSDAAPLSPSDAGPTDSASSTGGTAGASGSGGSIATGGAGASEPGTGGAGGGSATGGAPATGTGGSKPSGSGGASSAGTGGAPTSGGEASSPGGGLGCGIGGAPSAGIAAWMLVLGLIALRHRRLRRG
jgi:acyl-CoA thioesterase I